MQIAIKQNIMVNLSKYSNKAVLQLLKANNEFKQALYKGNHSALKVISDNYIVSAEQLEFLTDYINNKTTNN